MPPIIPCRSCHAPVRFLITAKGKQIPVNADTSKPEDYDYDRSRHTPHFATCPEAKRWSKKPRA